MQPLKSIAPQWEAKDKKLRPVELILVRSHPYHGNSLMSMAQESYDSQINYHTFDTDLPDRIYKADELNEPVYQYQDTERDGPDEWYNENEDTHERYPDFKDYTAHAKSLGSEYVTRQFVTLKQPTQTTN